MHTSCHGQNQSEKVKSPHARLAFTYVNIYKSTIFFYYRKANSQNYPKSLFLNYFANVEISLLQIGSKYSLFRASGSGPTLRPWSDQNFTICSQSFVHIAFAKFWSDVVEVFLNCGRTNLALLPPPLLLLIKTDISHSTGSNRAVVLTGAKGSNRIILTLFWTGGANFPPPHPDFLI